MKKSVCLSVLFLILWLYHLPAKAPEWRHVIMFDYPHMVNPYERIWIAVCMEESRMNPMAYNPMEDAVGISQIRPIRLEEYNRLTGKTYELWEMYDVRKSREVFMYYATKIGYRDWELIIRKWNGSGPMTYSYLGRVKKYLNT